VPPEEPPLEEVPPEDPVPEDPPVEDPPLEEPLEEPLEDPLEDPPLEDPPLEEPPSSPAPTWVQSLGPPPPQATSRASPPAAMQMDRTGAGEIRMQTGDMVTNPPWSPESEARTARPAAAIVPTCAPPLARKKRGNHRGPSSYLPGATPQSETHVAPGVTTGVLVHA
jgi:hypothetical protein